MFSTRNWVVKLEEVAPKALRTPISEARSMILLVFKLIKLTAGNNINKSIPIIKAETNSERSVLKKLQKYSRLSAIRGPSSIDDIRGIAAKGGYLSSEELGLILETGGFSSINDRKDSPQEPPKQGRLRKKKTRKLGVSRRGGRKGKSASRRD